MVLRKPISFIIPAYNYGHYLDSAVRSIANGNFGTNDEIIIVNDASTDNTAEVIQRLRDEIPSIRPLAHRHRKGCASAGMNTAIDVAQHDLFFGLAADNMLVPNTVAALLEFLEAQHADVAAFQELRFFTDDPTNPTHSWYYKELTTLADALSGCRWPGPDGHFLFTRDSWLKAGRCDEFFGGLDSWAFGMQHWQHRAERLDGE